MGQSPAEEVLAGDEMAMSIFALGNSHRRAILFGLAAGQIETVAGAMMRSGEAEEIRRELENEHLPLLEEAGYIEWDSETDEIKRGPNFDEIQPLLELMRNHPDELPPGWS